VIDMRRHVGSFLLIIGIGVLAWTATVYLWKDPFTTAYTAYEQRRLESNLEGQFERWEQTREPVSRPTKPAKPAEPAPRHDDLSRDARRFRLGSADGDAIAKLRVPRLDLDVVLVNGTSVADLRRGPGRHEETFMPGEGELVYVAGHRTTYGAPFRHVDELERGDRIVMRMPYGRLTYRVERTRIVDPSAVGVVRDVGHEQLVLTACHPLYSAKQRIVIFARLEGG
jgi:sortase A